MGNLVRIVNVPSPSVCVEPHPTLLDKRARFSHRGIFWHLVSRVAPSPSLTCSQPRSLQDALNLMLSDLRLLDLDAATEGERIHGPLANCLVAVCTHTFAYFPCRRRPHLSKNTLSKASNPPISAVAVHMFVFNIDCTSE